MGNLSIDKLQWVRFLRLFALFVEGKMKAINITALLALIISTVMGAYAVSDYPDYQSGSQQPCYNCPAPAWDRTPIYVQAPNNPYLPPTCPPQAWQADPWDKCGAFCAGGQTPVGWPWGWGAQYWLRPNSNF